MDKKKIKHNACVHKEIHIHAVMNEGFSWDVAIEAVG